MTVSSYRFVVSGRVQGVGFREAARRKAGQLGLSGWVENRPDSAVEGLACGTPEALANFRSWLGDGPLLARVDGLDWNPAEQSPAPGFVVRR